MSYFNQICNFSTHLHKSLRFMQMCRQITNLVKIWHIYRAVYVKTWVVTWVYLTLRSYLSLSKPTFNAPIYIWTDTTNLKDAFRDCAKAPKNVAAVQYPHLPLRLIAISDKLVNYAARNLSRWNGYGNIASNVRKVVYAMTPAMGTARNRVVCEVLARQGLANGRGN